MTAPQMNLRRGRGGPVLGPTLASVALHATVIAVVWWVHQRAPEEFEYIAYEVRMVSAAEIGMIEEMGAPPVAESEPEESPAEPEAEPEPEPEPEAAPTPAPTPRTQPRAETPTPRAETQPEPREPAPQPPATRAETATSTGTASEAQMLAQMEGLQRDFPEYYGRIQREMLRCLRPPAGSGNPTTVLRFEIGRDGRIATSSIDLYRRSGNGSFDRSAVAAVQCAGDGRIGPLPSELPMDILAVQFTFSPR